MKISTVFILIYVTGSVITFGHAANNDHIKERFVPAASAAWPFYLSYELWSNRS